MLPAGESVHGPFFDDTSCRARPSPGGPAAPGQNMIFFE